MYAALWRALPGPALVKVLLLLILVAGIVMALFEWGFPWLNDQLEIYDPTVG